jgi:integrase/recombinase XerD
MAVKRAKTLTKEQFDKLLVIVRASNTPLRDEVALRLSYFAGLRAGEIAKLRWSTNLLDATGAVSDNLHVTSDVGKRSVERLIPLDADLRALLVELRAARPDDEFVFYALHNKKVPMVPKLDSMGRVIKRAKETVMVVPEDWTPGRVTPNAVVQWFKRLYAQVGYDGCSSHSGRRTFITARARIANQTGCSIRDVQQLAGHRSLETTAAYIEPSEMQRDLVGAW